MRAYCRLGVVALALQFLIAYPQAFGQQGWDPSTGSAPPPGADAFSASPPPPGSTPAPAVDSLSPATTTSAPTPGSDTPSPTPTTSAPTPGTDTPSPTTTTSAPIPGADTTSTAPSQPIETHTRRTEKTVTLAPLQLTAAAATAPQPGRASLGWDPKHTWLFAVSVLEWQNKTPQGFTKVNRKDPAIIQAFRAHGIPENHIFYITDKQATLNMIRGRLVNLHQQTQPGDTLFFYFCGHGWIGRKDTGFFANYDATDDLDGAWSADLLADDMKLFRGDNAIFAIDCRQSAPLVQALVQSQPGYKFGVLGAAAGGDGTTSNWTFSQAFLDAMAGHRYADVNNDDVTTFSELASYMKREMKDLEQQDSVNAASSQFDPAFRLSTTVYKDESIPEKVEVLVEKEWRPAKLLEELGAQGRVRWISIGWDGPEDDEWVDLSAIRRVGETKQK